MAVVYFYSLIDIHTVLLRLGTSGLFYQYFHLALNPLKYMNNNENIDKYQKVLLLYICIPYSSVVYLTFAILAFYNMGLAMYYIQTESGV